MMSYEAYNDIVASARSLGCANGWETRGDSCYRHYPSSDGGWTWDQARRECKAKAYTVGHQGADLPFPETVEDNNFVKGLIGSEDVWLGGKFPVDQLQKKTSSGNPETWGDYTGWSAWRNGVTPARGISRERRLLMKGDTTPGVWVVWNGNEKKGFVCQYKKKACKTGWEEDTTSNKCLKAFTGDDNKMTWQNAQRKCEEQGLNGNLASLGSQDIVFRLAKAQPEQTQEQTPVQSSGSTANLQAAGAVGGNSDSTASQSQASGGTQDQTTLQAPRASGGNSDYEAYWLGGSVLYNEGSLTYTWTDGTLKWSEATTNHVNQAAWAAGYDVPTAWSGEVNTFINNDGKIGLNTGNDKTNFICQYDIPMTVQQMLQSGMYPTIRRSLF